MYHLLLKYLLELPLLRLMNEKNFWTLYHIIWHIHYIYVYLGRYVRYVPWVVFMRSYCFRFHINHFHNVNYYLTTMCILNPLNCFWIKKKVFYTTLFISYFLLWSWMVNGIDRELGQIGITGNDPFFVLQ